ncbi:hypothetical protein BCV70DRAFT_155851 [Testicularia cyperi]|uniref:Alpha/beta-hydrolase n=1 Tax=Testicularia cyperi TaxID=1882483 RepID=A0A317XXH5_9BASI|nr:hypothetical protein BCV70DRAFT_155851 [Testicularia cyperi]
MRASCVLASTLVAAASAATIQSNLSPTQDPGVYPGDDVNPPNGWSTLPNIPGARADNSTLVVGRGNATLMHYIDESYDASKIKRAVIQIHGENRDGWNQWIYADLAAKRAASGGSFSRDEVVVMAPQFFITVDDGAYPFDSTLKTTTVSSESDIAKLTSTSTSRTPQATLRSNMQLKKRQSRPVIVEKISTSQVMIWKTVEWGDGSPAYEPNNSRGAGSFDALDAAVNFFLDRERFPELRKVVVAGFSLGGQLVNRYATFRYNTPDDNRVIYWVSSPNSFVYLTGNRPASIGKDCRRSYADYKYGLNGTLPQYVTKADNELTASQLITRYLSRTVYYLCGVKDRTAGNSDCAANAQGLHHVSKMFHWTNEYLPLLPGSTGVRGKLPSNSLLRWVDQTGHEDWKLINSDPGIELAWLKGFNADGSDATAPPSNGVTAADTPTINAASASAALSLSKAGLAAFVLGVSLLPSLI